MKLPGPATLASIALHGGVAALLLVGWPQRAREIEPVPVVRVSVISDVPVAAAPADNPADELVLEDGAAAPPEPVEAEPTLEPQPTPPPTPLRPREKTVTPPRPQPQPRPPTPQPRPPTPQPKREEPSLDLDRLSERPRQGDRNRRPRTGDAGQGQAPRALGRADLSFLAGQIRVSCTPAFRDVDVTVQINIRLTEDGRLARPPRRVRPQNSAGYRALADSVERAIQSAAPFDMPAGYEEQDVILQFSSSSVRGC